MTISIEQAHAWYASADPVHDFEHVLRVYRLAEKIALAEGADLEIVRAAALLHDSVGSAPGGDGQERLGHHLTSARFAGEVLRAENWQPDRVEAVQHCIRAHRFRHQGERPQTLEAMCLYDADKLDVLGAIGAALIAKEDYEKNHPQFDSENFINLFKKTNENIQTLAPLEIKLSKPSTTPENGFLYKGMSKIKAFLGVDIGSISTNVGAIDEQGKVLSKR